MIFAQVPLIVAGRAIDKHTGPRRVGAPVELLDLYPTILGIAGVDPAAKRTGVFLSPPYAIDAKDSGYAFTQVDACRTYAARNGGKTASQFGTMLPVT